MEKVSFFESFIKVLKFISSMPLFIEILILTLLLMAAMIVFYFKKTETGKRTTLIIYIVTLFLLPITHMSYFIHTLDKMIENFVEIVYFPSVYTYIIMIIVTDFLLLKRLLNKKNEKWYIAFEFAYFFIFQFLFFLALRIVVMYSIDVFDKASIYYNQNLTSVVQILSYLFWIRVAIFLIRFAINKITSYESKKKIHNTLEVSDNTMINNTMTNSNVSVDYSFGGLNNSISNDMSTERFEQDNNLYDKRINTEQVNIVSNENINQNNVDLNKNIVQVINNDSQFENNNEIISDINTSENDSNGISASYVINNENETKATAFTNWDSSGKLNNLVSTDGNKNAVISNLNMNNTSLNVLDASTNNYAENFNNKNSSISSIQNSNSYDVNSVLSNVVSTDNNNNNNNNYNSNSTLTKNIDLSNDNTKVENELFDDFYD